jgi:hypothetical protein
MCEELNEELDNGGRLARELVNHMLAMGADKGTIPVFVNDERYEVTVAHIPVKPDA